MALPALRAQRPVSLWTRIVALISLLLVAGTVITGSLSLFLLNRTLIQAVDNNLHSGWPNSSSDDLRADAAAMRPSPVPKLVRQEQAEGRRVGGRSVGGPDYLVGGRTSSNCRGGRRRRERVREPGTR